MSSGLPTLDPLDRRLNLIDSTGQAVKSPGSRAGIAVAFTELRKDPDPDCAIDTQLMFGETVEVHDIRNGWAWVRADRDGYVGWLEEITLIHDPKPATHIVHVPRTFFYPAPDLKRPHKGMRSMGSALTVVGDAEVRGTKYLMLENGDAVIAKHVRPMDQRDDDYVSVAQSLVLTPYLWAGTTAFGLDCSGLVKLAKFMCGDRVLRDSDMQAATIGKEIDPGKNFDMIERGDLIFWNGHVAICEGPSKTGEQTVIHANGHSMNVKSEPLIEAVDRIAYLYEKPTGVRRP